MPTYEYVCTSCKAEWEVEQSMKADPITECPKCMQQTARRQISRGTGFILKGSGWYSDLYAASSNKPPAEGGSGEKATDAKAGSETKAATDGGSSDATASPAKGESGGTKTPTKVPPPAAPAASS